MKCKQFQKFVQIFKELAVCFKMASQKHAFVYLCKDANCVSAVPAEFEKCCLTDLGCRGESMVVGFTYNNGQLKVFPSTQGITLQHSQGCPCRFLTATDIASIPNDIKNQGVVAAVSVILQSSDKHVLLTRRAKHMRTFPGIWVPPGGHLEPGETLNDACLRELREETGLHFSQDQLTLSTLAMWESVYPPIISMGLPRRHHIVVYFLAQAREDHHLLRKQMQLDEEELDAATWLDEYTSRIIVNSDTYGQAMKMPMGYFSASVIQDGELTTKNLSLSVLMRTLPSSEATEVTGRLSSGTKFALGQWLNVLHPVPKKSLP